MLVEIPESREAKVACKGFESGESAESVGFMRYRRSLIFYLSGDDIFCLMANGKGGQLRVFKYAILHDLLALRTRLRANNSPISRHGALRAWKFILPVYLYWVLGTGSDYVSGSRGLYLSRRTTSSNH